MVNPIAAGLITSFVQIHWCRISGSIIEFEDRTGTRFSGGVANGLYRSFRNYFCDDPPAPAPPGTFEPPFTGGQCPKQYDFTVDAVFRGGENQAEQSGRIGQGRVYGPIQGIFIRVDGLNWQLIVRASQSPQPPVFDLVYAGGGFFDEGGYVRITSVNITPLDGVDDCGDLPPALPPPGDDFYSDDFTVNVNNGGNTYNFPITITSNPTPPTLDDDGDLSVPITITFPDNEQDIDIDINIDGDIDVTGGNPPIADNPNNPPNGSGGGNGSNPSVNDPDGYDTDGEPLPSPPEVEEPPEDPTQTTAIRGAIVTCSNASTVNGVTTIFQENGVPTVHAPYLGLLSFYITTAEGNGGWTADIPIKNARQFVICDWPGGAADVRVSPRGNAQLTVTPVLFRLDN